jgi:hypothetical protein
VAGQAELRAAVEALASADLDALSNEASLDSVAVLWPLVCAVGGQVARRVGRIHARQAAKDEGFVSTRAFLRTRLCVNPAVASGLVKAGAGLGGLAATRAALAAGEISVEHAAVLADAVQQLGDEVMVGAEKVLLDYARGLAPNELRGLVRELELALMSQEQATGRQERLHRKREFTASKTFAGSVSVQGLLDPVQGEALLAALAAYTAGPDPDGFAGRTPGQRRADALADICTAALAATDRPTAGGDRPQVTVTVSLDALRRDLSDDTNADHGDPAAIADPLGRLADPDRWARLGHCREPICAEAARRLACDAGVIPVLLGGRSEPLDIGRLTRVVPAGMRRALELRDGGCRFPGCDRPASWCDAHHILSWARGGPTCLTNLVLACAFHHTLVHEGQWTLNMHPITLEVRVFRPNGRLHDLTSKPRGPTSAGR